MTKATVQQQVPHELIELGHVAMFRKLEVSVATFEDMRALRTDVDVVSVGDVESVRKSAEIIKN